MSSVPWQLLVLGLVACGSAETSAPSPQSPQPADEREDFTPPFTFRPPSWGPGVPPLGAPCGTPNPADQPPTLDTCGTRGRIAVRWNPATSFEAGDAPCKLHKIALVGQDVQAACVANGRLYAARWCVPCRVVGAGWSAVAELSETTRPQALAIQERLGLPHRSALQGATEWNEAIFARR